MPLKPVDYSNSIVYKIVCNDLDIKDCYVGSTTNFTKRKQQHKRLATCDKETQQLQLYSFIKENGGWSNWSMVLIDTYNCNTKLELLKIERENIELENATLNKNIPSREKKEYVKQEHIKEQQKEHMKNYRMNNAEKIKIKNKQYKENNKEKIAERQKEHMKNYRMNNAEKIKIKNKQYKENNKEKIAEYAKTYLNRPIQCICGKIYTYKNGPRHKKSKYHIENSNNNEDIEYDDTN